MDEELSGLAARAERIEREDWSAVAGNGVSVRRRAARAARARRAAVSAVVLAVVASVAVGASLAAPSSRQPATAPTGTGTPDDDPASRLSGLACEQFTVPGRAKLPPLQEGDVERYALRAPDLGADWVDWTGRRTMTRRDVYSMGATGMVAKQARQAVAVSLARPGAAPEWFLTQYLLTFDPAEAPAAFDTLARQLVCDPTKGASPVPGGMGFLRPQTAGIVLSRTERDGAVLAVRGFENPEGFGQSPWTLVAWVGDRVATLTVLTGASLSVLGPQKPGDELVAALADAVLARLRGLPVAAPVAFPVADSPQAPPTAAMLRPADLGPGWRADGQDRVSFSGSPDTMLARSADAPRGCPHTQSFVTVAQRTVRFRGPGTDPQRQPEVAALVTDLKPRRGPRFVGTVRDNIASGCSAVLPFRGDGSVAGIGDDAFLLRAGPLGPGQADVAFARVGDTVVTVQLYGVAKDQPYDWRVRVLRAAVARLTAAR
ncbi:hypothetical protein [Motilibacter deserti]|uniref:Beta-lactamase family protein n=1 Tax=Motilibacter deserti TaxID=2714956 RepID=A0ABX0GZW3_9ACTN|nr:hypothetical protein [Motilibacter deserti]NHC16357.1 hypothetical protein [Motilibacter deserti]